MADTEKTNIKNQNTAENSDSISQGEVRQELKTSLEFHRNIDAFWKSKISQIYEKKMELTDPLFPRINNLRQAIRFYIIPALQKVMEAPVEFQDRFIKYLPFLFSEEKAAEFLRHFYAVVKDEKGEWQFIDRDRFWTDELILYDLYKVKRTMKGISALLKERANSRQDFQCFFDRNQQNEILNNMNAALFMAFKMSIKPEHQVKIFKEISLNYLYEDQIKERRKKKIVFSKENEQEASPYRRIFFHILFRNTINTKIKGKETRIHYNLVDFQQLLDEYFTFFMDGADGDPEIMRIYHNFHIQGKSFSENIINEPDQESLLMEDIDEIKTII